MRYCHRITHFIRGVLAILKRILGTRISLLILFFISLTTVSITGYAQETTNQRLYDQANLLSTSEKQTIEDDIKKLQQQTGMDAVVVTTNTTDGKSWEAYADDFYYYGGYGKNDTNDGFLFLIDMEHRKYHISTTGEMIAILSGSRIDQIIDDAASDMKSGNYYGAISLVLSDVEQFVAKGAPDGTVYNAETGKLEHIKSLSPIKIIVAIIIALATASSVFIIIWRRYQLKGSVYAYPYYDFGTVTLTESQDIKTSDIVTTRHIPKNNNSGGGGTHMGSSGTSHGGGSGSF